MTIMQAAKLLKKSVEARAIPGVGPKVKKPLASYVTLARKLFKELEAEGKVKKSIRKNSKILEFSALPQEPDPEALAIPFPAIR